MYERILVRLSFMSYISGENSSHEITKLQVYWEPFPQKMFDQKK